MGHCRESEDSARDCGSEIFTQEPRLGGRGRPQRETIENLQNHRFYMNNKTYFSIDKLSILK